MNEEAYQEYMRCRRDFVIAAIEKGFTLRWIEENIEKLFPLIWYMPTDSGINIEDLSK